MKKFLELAKRFRSMPIIDDDFPEARDEFDLELDHMLRLPTIVVLCGSTRFGDAFAQINRELTDAGNIVLSVGNFIHNAERDAPPPELKARLDQLHFDKIVLADEVVVLNVGGYIGESTRNEIRYADHLGKPTYFLEATNFVAPRKAPFRLYEEKRKADLHAYELRETIHR